MENICIPMHLDAFALSPGCCDEKLKSKIAPYTQPNYTALRLDSHLLQHDVLDHTDFHLSQPATRNPRIADIGRSPPDNLKHQRLGVHLQWSLPRLYRTATASGRRSAIADGTDDPSQPVFRQIPNRWLVTRHLKNHQETFGPKEFQSWIIESDAVQNIKTIPQNVDLESGVAPFVSYEGDPGDPSALNAQIEVFLGQKFDLEKWPGEDGQRKPLPGGITLMTSSNPLFGDYALHNCNVLSIIDNFSYKRNPDPSDKNPRDDDFSYLANALCDYFVIGWHQDPKNDPLNVADGTDLTSRLTSLMLKLSPSEAGDQGTLKDLKEVTRCLVHGAIYDVKYNYFGPPPRSLAEEGALKFTPEIKMEPLSIGTTPLDGILAFLEAHQHDDDKVNVFGPGGSTLSQKIVELSQLLYAAADEYDSRVQAQDLIAQQNFTQTDGGSRWTYSKGARDDKRNLSQTNDGKPKIPTDGEKLALDGINEAQIKLDVCSRKLRSLKWDLFAEWFKFKGTFLPEVGKKDIFDAFKKEVLPIKERVIGLQTLIDSLKAEIESLQAGVDSQVTTSPKPAPFKKPSAVDCKLSTKDAFRMRIDPTLCIAGLDSGWASDVMETLQIRVDHELTSDITAVNSIFPPKSANPVTQDHGLRSTATKILAECLKDANSNTKNGKDDAPLITGFQAWGDRNPFAPLFIEWESLYYHIDMDSWDVQLRPSPVGHPNPQVRYVPREMLLSDQEKNANNQNNFRTLSGRVLVLPQPRFSLENVVLQVLDSKSPDIPSDINADDLKSSIRQIKFISAPLSGLTNHLLTRCEGAHVKPNVRTQGQKVIPLAAADAGDIGMDLPTLALVDAESALTPYGSLMAFGEDQYPHNPFKPVMHGQMVFTKLNIIDKFGQGICLPAINRRRVHQPHPPDAKIYPCLSDYLAPDVIKVKPDDKTGILNTVFATPDPAVDGQWPLCQFIQLTPSINQDARINASFLTQDTVAKGNYTPWREINDYESPIWGWLIIDYADNGLQFFRGDGTFYREIRKGGVQGANVSAKWLPNDPPKEGLEPTDAGTDQLDQLLKQLSQPTDKDGSYLQAFFNMINGAIQNMPFPPSSYSGYANAIVGKPLALVNVGWSIELAEPPIRPQYNSFDKRPDEWQAELDRYKLEGYGFKLKVGDHERNYDGVVGYYLSSNDDAPSPTAPTPQPKTTWDKLYTYFLPEKPHANVTEIVPDIYPPLSPYYINPEPDVTPNMTSAKARKYTVTSVLMDPYTPIHGYSPILPTKSLTLPPWTVQTAMDKMHAFFHLGPSLVAVDVPTAYADANAKNPDGTPLAAVSLPISGRKGTWTWLQPYAQDGADTVPQFATMDVQEDLGQKKFESAPYTFLEGYLQLIGRLDDKGDK